MMTCGTASTMQAETVITEHDLGFRRGNKPLPRVRPKAVDCLDRLRYSGCKRGYIALLCGSSVPD